MSATLEAPRASTDPRPAIRSVSVVIPVLNAAATLGEQLEALAGQGYVGEWEVVIADNGSTDGSRDVAMRWAPKLPALRVVDASSRGGVSHARNAGARAARGDLVLICDSDDVVAPGWIEAMTRAAAEADVLGGSFDEASLNDPVLRGWRDPYPEPLPTVVGFLPFAVGSNFGVRAAVFRALGGWNEEYVGGGDDVEFSWRAQLRGYRLAFVPDAVVRYRYRTGLRPHARQFYAYGLSHAHLYRDFRRFGAKRERLVDVARDLRWWLRHRRDHWRSPEGRGKWVAVMALRAGRLAGSLRYRTLYL